MPDINPSAKNIFQAFVKKTKLPKQVVKTTLCQAGGKQLFSASYKSPSPAARKKIIMKFNKLSGKPKIKETEILETARSFERPAAAASSRAQAARASLLKEKQAKLKKIKELNALKAKQRFDDDQAELRQQASDKRTEQDKAKLIKKNIRSYIREENIEERQAENKKNQPPQSGPSRDYLAENKAKQQARQQPDELDDMKID